MPIALIFSSTSYIAASIIDQLLSQHYQVVAVQRCNFSVDQWRGIDPQKTTSLQQALESGQLTIINGDSGDNQLDDVFQHLHTLDNRPPLVISCAGLLHSKDQQPEKSVRQLDADFLYSNLTANTLTAVHIAQRLESLYKRKDDFTYVVLTAKVGSISDNHLGGWYSYRMTKAATNMFIKTLSIEWQRRFPNACVLSVHPGTTDTPLSKPFQKNIPKERLFTTDTSAERILKIAQTAQPQQSGRFLFWDGSEILW